MYLIWFFLVGSIVIMIADMMLEEWAGMDVLEGGTLMYNKFFKGKGGASAGVKKAAASKSAAKAKTPAKGKKKR